MRGPDRQNLLLTNDWFSFFSVSRKEVSQGTLQTEFLLTCAIKCKIIKKFMRFTLSAVNKFKSTYLVNFYLSTVSCYKFP